jgi:putative sterol carrier protein
MGELSKLMDENWVKKYQEEFNKDEGLVKSLSDFSALVEMGILDGDKRNFQVVVENGKVTYSGPLLEGKKPDFRIYANKDLWKSIAEKKQGVKGAIVTRKIRFEGSMMVAMKYLSGLTGALQLFGKVPTDYNV